VDEARCCAPWSNRLDPPVLVVAMVVGALPFTTQFHAQWNGIGRVTSGRRSSRPHRVRIPTTAAGRSVHATLFRGAAANPATRDSGSPRRRSARRPLLATQSTVLVLCVALGRRALLEILDDHARR